MTGRKSLLITTLFLLCGSVWIPGNQKTDADEDVRFLARQVAQRIFVPSAEDPERDSLTGLDKSSLVAKMEEHFASLQREEPRKFEELRERERRNASAALLYREGLDEASSGDIKGALNRWNELLLHYPESEVADDALLKLSARYAIEGREDKTLENLDKAIELEFESSSEQELLVRETLTKLRSLLEKELRRRGDPEKPVELGGRPSTLSLDTLRMALPWCDGFERLDGEARHLRIETSGDLLRILKNPGKDAVTLD